MSTLSYLAILFIVAVASYALGWIMCALSTPGTGNSTDRRK